MVDTSDEEIHNCRKDTNGGSEWILVHLSEENRAFVMESGLGDQALAAITATSSSNGPASSTEAIMTTTDIGPTSSVPDEAPSNVEAQLPSANPLPSTTCGFTKLSIEILDNIIERLIKLKHVKSFINICRYTRAHYGPDNRIFWFNFLKSKGRLSSKTLLKDHPKRQFGKEAYKMMQKSTNFCRYCFKGVGKARELWKVVGYVGVTICGKCWSELDYLELAEVQQEYPEIVLDSIILRAELVLTGRGYYANGSVNGTSGSIVLFVKERDLIQAVETQSGTTYTVASSSSARFIHQMRAAQASYGAREITVRALRVLDTIEEIYTEATSVDGDKLFQQYFILKTPTEFRNILQQVFLDSFRPFWQVTRNSGLFDACKLYSDFFQLLERDEWDDPARFRDIVKRRIWLQLKNNFSNDPYGIFPAKARNEILAKWIEDYGIDNYLENWKMARTRCKYCRNDRTLPRGIPRSLCEQTYTAKTLGWHLWVHHRTNFELPWHFIY